MKRVVMHVMRTLNTDSEYDHCSMVIDDAVGELRHFSPDGSHGWADVDGAVKEKQFATATFSLLAAISGVVPLLLAWFTPAFLGQQQRHDQTKRTRYVKWRGTIIRGLIHIDASLPAAKTQPHMGILTRHKSGVAPSSWPDSLAPSLPSKDTTSAWAF